jgi:hypothetical protein
VLKTVLYGKGPQLSSGGWSFGQIHGVGHSQGYGTPIHTSYCGFLSLQSHGIQNHSYGVRHLSWCGIELNMYFSHTVLIQMVAAVVFLPAKRWARKNFEPGYSNAREPLAACAKSVHGPDLTGEWTHAIMAKCVCYGSFSHCAYKVAPSRLYQLALMCLLARA